MFKDEVAAGAYDHMLVNPQRRERDAFVEAEERDLEATMYRGRVDPSSLFETILSGPGKGGDYVTTSGDYSVAVSAEDGGWLRVGGSSGAASMALPSSGREQMCRYLYWLYAHNPFARNIINNYTFFTIGEGFRVNWKKPSKLEAWNETAKLVKFRKRVRKIIKHTYLLGEWFTLIFPAKQKLRRNEAGTLETTLNEVQRDPDKPRILRGLGPDEIEEVIVRGDRRYDPGNVEDAETPIAYKRLGRDEYLGAGDVIHHKIEELGNLTRGLFVLQPALRYLRYMEKFVDNRHWLNFVRSRIPLVRKVRGGSARVNAEKTRISSLPPPGTIATENESTSYEFPSFNLEAEDARHDGRLLLLTIAASVGLPEFVVTSDASNQNYASSLAAEHPMIKMFEELQWLWVPDIEIIVSELTGEPTSEFDVTPGAILRRSLKQVADGTVPLVQAGIMSKRSAATQAGLDYDAERKYMMREEADAVGLEARTGMMDDPDEGDDDDGEPVDQGGRPARDVRPGDDGQGGRRPRPSAE